jgi:hypothetical protein
MFPKLKISLGLILNLLKIFRAINDTCEKTSRKLLPAIFLGMAGTMECVYKSDGEHFAGDHTN